MRKVINNLLETAFCHDNEGFVSNYGGSTTMPSSKKNSWLILLSFILVEILILIFGKFLWNRVAIKIIPTLKPILSIWEILGLSILIKLLTN